MSFANQDEQKDSKNMKNYKVLTVANGRGGILSIGKNITLIKNYEDIAVTWKYTYYMTSIIAMTLIKDCWYIIQIV